MQSARPPGEQGVEQVGEVGRHLGERLREHRGDLIVDRTDHLAEVATGVADVLELVAEELVALAQGIVLLERQRVDRAHQFEFPLEFGDPGDRRGALWEVGTGSAEDGVGLTAELVADGLGEVLEAEPGLGPVDLEPVQALPCLGQRPFGISPLATEAIESRRHGPHPFGLSTTLLAQPVESQVSDRHAGVERLDEAPGGRRPLVEFGASSVSLLPLVVEVVEAARVLGDPVEEKVASGRQVGHPDLVGGPEATHFGGALLDVAALLGHAPTGFHGLGLGVLEARKPRLEVGDPGPFVAEPGLEHPDSGPEALGLVDDVTAFGLKPLECLGGRREAAIVDVELADMSRDLVLEV